MLETPASREYAPLLAWVENNCFAGRFIDPGRVTGHEHLGPEKTTNANFPAMLYIVVPGRTQSTKRHDTVVHQLMSKSKQSNVHIKSPLQSLPPFFT